MKSTLLKLQLHVTSGKIIVTNSGYEYRDLAKTVVCKDGFTASIQASQTHYCTPRTLTDYYTEMEIGFPSQSDDLIMEYAEDKDNPTGTVYGYVPVEVIAALIDKHGGFKD